MKFATAYYLLLIYLTVMLQPLIPIAEDAISHCFAEAYHVATVHAKYGNNHVEIALADDAKDEDNSKNTAAPKAGEQSTVHLFVKELAVQKFENDQPKEKFFYTSDKPCSIYILKNIPPPKFLI